jgi:hypothetical protein
MLGDGELTAHIAIFAIKIDCQAVSPAAWIARAVAIDPFDECRSIGHIDTRQPGLIFAAVVNRQPPMMQKRIMASGADKNSVGYSNRIHAAASATLSALAMRSRSSCSISVSPLANLVDPHGNRQNAGLNPAVDCAVYDAIALL